MENRLKKKMSGYINHLKDDIAQEYMKSHSDVDEEQKGKFLEFIKNYAHLQLEEDDFSKRKRVKNHVPEYDRCNAKRADGTQCTRRKKSDSTFCGTHIKGRPHGSCGECSVGRRVELSVCKVRGINHYMNGDQMYNVESVLSGNGVVV